MLSTPGDKGVSRIDSTLPAWAICEGGSCGVLSVKETQAYRTGKMSSGQKITRLTAARWVCRSCGKEHLDYERVGSVAARCLDSTSTIC